MVCSQLFVFLHSILFCDSSMLFHVTIVHSLLLLSSILFFENITVYIFHPLMDIWVIFNLRPQNKAAMNIHVQIFVGTHAFFSWEWEEQIICCCVFNFLRNSQTIFQTDCIISHSNKECIRVPFPPHPQHHFSF